MKLALIELDGIIANATHRFAHAEQVKQQAVQQGMAMRETTELYWQTVFTATAENVGRDLLIDGAGAALDALERQGYGVIFLTSRPEIMREATTAWLSAHDITTQHPAFFSRLFMKPVACKYVKTALWKAGMLQMLAAVLDAHEVLFVDPLIANQQEVLKQGLATLFHLRGCFSLAEAIAPPLEGETVETVETGEDEHPF